MSENLAIWDESKFPYIVTQILYTWFRYSITWRSYCSQSKDKTTRTNKGKDKRSIDCLKTKSIEYAHHVRQLSITPRFDSLYRCVPRLRAPSRKLSFARRFSRGERGLIWGIEVRIEDESIAIGRVDGLVEGIFGEDLKSLTDVFPLSSPVRCHLQ